jgi:type IV secretion system protein VirB10
VQAGSVIPGALITGIRSDLPGQITAQVTENVFDTPTGRFLLIPQGARLIGVYDSQVATGQSRVLLVWTRLIMPNGRSIVLERQQGADPGGYAGLEDEVDNHWKQLIGAALLSTLLSVGSEVNAQRRPHRDATSGIWELRQPDRATTGSAADEHPADIDDQAGVSGVGDRQPRPRDRAVS